MFYDSELKALKRANRFRELKIYAGVKDLASNDYLGLAGRKKSLKKACSLLQKYKVFAPKASLLVNGYHPLHKEFEETLASANGFESGLVAGSGFLANIALIEALVRSEDELFIDSEYHASGVLASRLVKRLKVFAHNDFKDLEALLKNSKAKRKIVAIEGVYSMSGDIAKKEFFEIALKYGAILIVDEAHSSGTIGRNLLGVFDYYGLEIAPNFIKMGTLGKAYGSYGAYILCSSEIKSFLVNRGKSIIYSTAPSVFDTALALTNFNYILKNCGKLYKKLQKRREAVCEILNIKSNSQIFAIETGSNKRALELQKKLLNSGFFVGAIRQPTVEKPIIRLIPRIGVKIKDIKEAARLVISD